MKIDDAIQSKFKDNKQRATVNLLYTANWLSSQISDILKEKDITHQQYNVLRILRGAKGEPVSLKYVKERMLDRMSDVSRIVDKLLKKKHLQRNQCPNDRRNVDITITKDGLQLLADLDAVMNEKDDVFSSFTDEEINIFNELLDKLRGD